MPPKRKGDGASEEPTARERKKQKTAIARTIAVQPGTTPLSNAVAGPSKSVRFNSMQGLPGSLDVERFAEARAFEINAMHDAMQSAQSNATQRAWQQLPRHLRRRAASHDVRRVPLRLRDKARAEMDTMRRKALGRSMPKRGITKRLKRTKKFLQRQGDKKWLETHIWHAKRMKMENMWDYRLAVEPTEKSFRPSHRASIHGSILHDASYFAVIELKGPEDILRAIFDSCCDLRSPSAGAKRYLSGARVCETHLYKYGSYPFDLIAPVTILWLPVCNTASAAPRAARTIGTTGKRKAKGKEKATEEVQQSKWSPDRVTWIHVHPAVIKDVYEALRTAASFALKAMGQTPGRPECQVEIIDLREQLNIFEIMGPKSSQVIKGALSPVRGDDRADFKQFWSNMDNIQTAGSLPRGMVVGFTVDDPRLSFPPKNAQIKYGSDRASSCVDVFPSAALARSQIWDRESRDPLRKPRFKKTDLDKRRSKNLVPSTKLQPTQKDNQIPVLLIQRSLGSSSEAGRTDESPSIHGWILVVPSGWAMPFLSSLIYTGTRVGGQRERQTQAFESGCPYFPRDYPFTEPYVDYAEEREEEEQSKWERKPPAKRVNFHKLGTRSPWKPDWEVVLGLQPTLSSDPGLIEAQRVPAPRGNETSKNGHTEGTIRPWLLRGADLSSMVQELSTMLNPAAGLRHSINQLRVKRGQDPMNNPRADELWKSALVWVRITPFGRGNPEDLALIYIVGDEEARKWYQVNASKEQGVAGLSNADDDGIELSRNVPAQESIIGYITTGHYSLSRGTGCAIGAIPVQRLFELRQQAERLRASSLLVIVRDRGDDFCRAAGVEVIVE